MAIFKHDVWKFSEVMLSKVTVIVAYTSMTGTACSLYNMAKLLESIMGTVVLKVRM